MGFKKMHCWRTNQRKERILNGIKKGLKAVHVHTAAAIHVVHEADRREGVSEWLHVHIYMYVHVHVYMHVAVAWKGKKRHLLA